MTDSAPVLPCELDGFLPRQITALISAELIVLAMEAAPKRNPVFPYYSV